MNIFLSYLERTVNSAVLMVKHLVRKRETEGEGKVSEGGKMKGRNEEKMSIER